MSKRNTHSKRASNVAVNRRYKRIILAVAESRIHANRAARRAPLREEHAERIAAKAAAKLAAAQAPQS